MDYDEDTEDEFQEKLIKIEQKKYADLGYFFVEIPKPGDLVFIRKKGEYNWKEAVFHHFTNYFHPEWFCHAELGYELAPECIPYANKEFLDKGQPPKIFFNMFELKKDIASLEKHSIEYFVYE